ncbi:hypothetical protein RHMOL_Rhmol04G0049300 [Rhododendron molle]|uniref:Uncharacterized protein n=1 Tax=Rhododendron molle TaxID=49168 RepID=A0ACC0NX70_RHOML|nr:hypothetical protein RHMOL_Rhmol04G0049300 [Rhododendron molle]
MAGRSPLLPATRRFRPDLGQNALATFRNRFFTIFVLGVLIFTYVAVIYQPEDPLFSSSTKITSFLTSTSSATFISDKTIVKTGEHFLVLNQAAVPDSINIADIDRGTMSAILKKKDMHPVLPTVGETANDSLPVEETAHDSLPVEETANDSLPVTVGETANDSLPVGETVNGSLPSDVSEASFSSRRYLLYHGGGDRCKSMSHYLWSFMCALGEAQYLNRTLVMDTSICLSSVYTSSHQDGEKKDFRFYFDFDHLKESDSLLDSRQFAFDWTRWHRRNGLKRKVVKDSRTTPTMLSWFDDTLVMRKFGSKESDSYWYNVCKADNESVVEPPWHSVRKSKLLRDIASSITSRLNWDFDSVHVERGDKAKNKELWPNLDADTSPKALLSKLTGKIEDGRSVYVATNEPGTSFFDPLKEKYNTHFIDEYKDLWSEKSKWYKEITKLTDGVPVEFDGYMKISVDMEVFSRGKKQIETFNDLTEDCKDGIKSCTS